MSTAVKKTDEGPSPDQQSSNRRGKSSRNGNAFTAGQKPRWVWAVVLAGALAIGAVLTVLLGGESFSVTGWLIFSAVVYIIGMYITTRVIENRRRATDGLWRNLVWAAFIIALIPLVSLLWTVFAQGLPTLLANPGLFTEDMSTTNGATDQATVDEGASLSGGFVHGLIGTLMITVLSTVISVPIGLMASIYLVEYSRGGLFSRSITFFVDVMTGIPSIVAGLFAFAAVQMFVTTFLGTSPAHLQMVKMGLTAAIALSVLMIPIVVRSTEEMLRVVPNELREASYALGVRKWKTIMKVVLPTSISGIASGVTLAIARVAGETAPILVTAGFLATTNWNPFDGWMTALPVFIYRQLVNPTAPGAPMPSELRAWAAALVLIVIVMLLNLLARIIAQAFAPKKSGR